MTEEPEGLLPPGDMSLDELLGASRGIQEVDSLEALLEESKTIQLLRTEGHTVRLSRFTLRQLSRANKIRSGYKRSGGRLKKVKQKKAWQTKRKEKRKYNQKLEQYFYRYQHRYGVRWQVTMDSWLQEVGPLVEGYRLRIGVYEKEAPMTLENLWFEDSRSGEKLWEGAEERLRLLGHIV